MPGKTQGFAAKRIVVFEIVRAKQAWVCGVTLNSSHNGIGELTCIEKTRALLGKAA